MAQTVETRIQIEIPGTGEMQAKLAAKPKLIRRAVIRALRISGESVYARALANVSGKVLKVQTGTLRRRLHTTPVSEEGESLFVTIADPVSYAPIHEYGGTFTVPQHQRRAFARGRGGRKQRVAGLGKNAPFVIRKLITIRAHTATYPARPFMRPALEESKPDIERHFRTFLTAALQEAQ